MFSSILGVNHPFRLQCSTDYAAVCVVCYKKKTEFMLQKCSGCKLVFYCSKEHQVLHWPVHKELCLPIQKMVEMNGNVGLFDNYCNTNFTHWMMFREALHNVCEGIIKRRLSAQEAVLFVNPFSCQICHSYKPDSMITCKDCCVVSYCSQEHQLKDESSHSLVCRELKFSLELDSNMSEAFVAILRISYVSTLPSDMKAFIDKYVEVETTPRMNNLYVGCFITDYLTIPLTLIYVMEKSNIDLTKESLRVHIVGGNLFEGRASWSWEFIFHYFKQLRVIDFVFVGPEVLEINLPPTLTCLACCMKSVNPVFVSSLYHDYRKGVTEFPDIILAYNCGFGMSNNITCSTWKDSMPALCSYPGAVVAFTSCDEDQAKLDLKMLKEFSKNDNLQVLIECQENPFRSLKPNNDRSREDNLVYYNNKSITIIRS